MILSRGSILEKLDNGQIVITPLDKKNIGPNSIDLHLADELYQYSYESFTAVDTGEELVPTALDPEKGELKLVPVPKQRDGRWLMLPGTLYLAKTHEYTESHGLVPMLDGRSSIGRLGLSAHVTAGRGDIGFCGNWTLEITAVHPILVRPMMRFCQIYYFEHAGESEPYQGRYQGSVDTVASRFGVEHNGRLG